MFPWFLDDEASSLDIIFNADKVRVEATAPTELIFNKSLAHFMGYPLIEKNIHGNRPKVLKSVDLLEGGIKKMDLVTGRLLLKKEQKFV